MLNSRVEMARNQRSKNSRDNSIKKELHYWLGNWCLLYIVWYIVERLIGSRGKVV